MRPTSRLLLTLLTLCLTLEASAQTAACPPGEKQICLDGCLCLPDLSPLLGTLPDNLFQVAAPALATWLSRSRAEAAMAGTQSIPDNIREQLLRWYPPSVLDAASYKVGDSGELNAANAMLQNPDIGAVTLIDIIVFRTAENAQNVALWAHELKHVQQYQEWGVEGFAQRYVEDFNAIESPAYAVQAEVGRVLRGLAN
ncbi:MAG: eCIS core domain-containing protein [Pseudomonas sp.]